jgi:pimeloyl-ACP methyl ester carboxylesterase
MTGYADRTWTSSDGLQLHARDYGGATGPARTPVICLHGLTRNARDFEDVAPWIASQGRRVLAVDVRGRGASAWDPRPKRYLPQTYAEDVLRLMAAAGIERAVFIGTSMGGLVTMALAARRPSRVAAAILNDVGPELSPAGLARIGTYAGKSVAIADWNEAAAYAKAQNVHAFPDLSDAEWLAFAGRILREDARGIRPDYDPDIVVPFTTVRPLTTHAMWALFRNLARKRPLLLIRGQTSDILAPEITARMRKLARHMSYAEIPGVGHAPMLTEPAAKTAIETFLGDAP